MCFITFKYVESFKTFTVKQHQSSMLYMCAMFIAEMIVNVNVWLCSCVDQYEIFVCLNDCKISCTLDSRPWQRQGSSDCSTEEKFRSPPTPSDNT